MSSQPVLERVTDSGAGQTAGAVAPAPSSSQQAAPKKSAKLAKGRKWLLLAAAAVVIAGVVAYVAWRRDQAARLPVGFASSNGRIEATEIDIATKVAGRVQEIMVSEGDFVTAGQVLAQMDNEVLKAQLREAEAELRRAKTAVETAKSSVTQRESEMAAAEAVVLQRDAEFDLATRNFTRAESLASRNVITKEEFDTVRAALYSNKAAVSRAKADVAAATAAISTAKSQIIQAEASVAAAEARIDRIQEDINDTTLKSRRDGRVQYRITQPGEVLSAGGKVLNMVDLSDVYMTFFLPTEWAGRVSLGSETRIVLDAAPQFVIPANVTYVADVAQFTPKTVETPEERQKLTFRVKAHIPPEVLRKYIREVKTGLPGVAYVQLDPQAIWPSKLEVTLPEGPSPIAADQASDEGAMDEGLDRE